MRDQVFPDDGTPEDISAVLGFLASENEVLRCAAARALTGAGPLEREALARALLDPDPDVRADAMERLAGCAAPDHAPLLRRSLEGDPVREVKLAAIAGLARLGDPGAVPILRALVASRCEDRVAWEDQDSDWEDWLDIQIAAIAALGQMGIDDAIVDMLEARADDLAQSLDVPVFAALAQMGRAGVESLLDVVELEGGLARQRAVKCLARLSPEDLADHAPALLGSDDPTLRIAGLVFLPEDGAEIAAMARGDADAGVRRAALLRAAPAQPGLARDCLADTNADVQAAALRALGPQLDGEFAAELADHLLAWVCSARTPLMVAAVEALPDRMAFQRAEPALLALAQDTDRPLEARLAAVRTLDRGGAGCGTLAAILRNPAQQIRTAALVALHRRAACGEAEAELAIIRAISGTLLSGSEAVQPRPDTAAGPDAATPRGEDPGPQRIRITPEGDIVETAEDGRAEASTLTAILGEPGTQPAPPPPQAEDTPEETTGKRRKRRPVEGPDETAAALSGEAMQVCASLPAPGIGAALLAQAGRSGKPGHAAAWQALARHHTAAAAPLTAPASAAAQGALEDDDPIVRHAAYTMLLAADADPGLLARAAQEADAMIRAMAVPHMEVAQVHGALCDAALHVRQAAVQRLLAIAGPDDIDTAVDALVVGERADTLGAVIAASHRARRTALALLGAAETLPRAALVLLGGLAAAA